MGLGRCVVTHIICTGMQKKIHALWFLSWVFMYFNIPFFHFKVNVLTFWVSKSLLIVIHYHFARIVTNTTKYSQVTTVCKNLYSRLCSVFKTPSLV